VLCVSAASNGGKEDTMRTLKLVLAAGLLFAIGLRLGAEERKPPSVKHVPMARTSPVSGQDMYKNYCASCHGRDAKGHGPTATALKVQPADLTTLARRHGGKYPSLAVKTAIRGDSSVLAHGSKEMPVWGSLFWNLSGGDQQEVHLRLTNLTHYVESLQVN